MLHEAIGDEARHHLAGVADVLSAAVAQREGERVGDVVGRCGFEVDDSRNGRTKKERSAEKSPRVPGGRERGPKKRAPDEGILSVPAFRALDRLRDRFTNVGAAQLRNPIAIPDKKPLAPRTGSRRGAWDAA